jgi:oxygen-dependent protoporphyrinogen oxidase
VAEIPGLALAGNAYHGIGVPDCIRSGMQAASAVAQLTPESLPAGR